VTAAVLTAGAAVEVKKVSHPQQPVSPSTSSLTTGGVTAPTVSYDAPAPASHPSRAHRKAVASRQAKKDAAPQDAADATTATDSAGTAATPGKHHHVKPGDEAGASTSEPAITVTVTQTPPATTTVTTAPIPTTPSDGSGSEHQPPPPPPPAASDPPPPPSDEPPPPSGGEPQP
jgi:molecular chaperone DnaK